MGKINKQSALLTVRLGPGQKRKLVKLAATRGLTLQSLARQMVAKAVAKP